MGVAYTTHFPRDGGYCETLAGERYRAYPMRLRHVYLVLCVLGFLLPYSQFLPWLLAHGFNPSLFLEDLFANRIGGFFGLDVLVSAVVVCVLALTEGRRLGLRGLWLPIAATFVVGVSLGLPLFLYLRQVHLDRAEAEVA